MFFLKDDDYSYSIDRSNHLHSGSLQTSSEKNTWQRISMEYADTLTNKTNTNRSWSCITGNVLQFRHN